MPIIQVKLSGEKSAALEAVLADGLLALTTQILRKRSDLTAITFECVAPESWWVGGRTLQDLGLRSVFCAIVVTDETNTKTEKAAWQAAVFALFVQHMGALHEVSYVCVQDARAAAWGYGGRTQEWRGMQTLA